MVRAGRWRRIITIDQSRWEDKYILHLECGHRMVIHRDVPDPTGKTYDQQWKHARCMKCGEDDMVLA